MEKVVLKPGDVIPSNAFFDSVNVNGESAIVGIVVYVPDPKPSESPEVETCRSEKS